jgi:predicted ribosomally synthesized peptide with SipW-like signal peptide
MTINRKIVTSALSIGTAGALLVGATFALFTDQAQSTGNSFTSGNADLQIGLDTGDENTVVFQNSVDAPDYSNIAPGFTGNTDFWLKNNSSSAISLDVVADLANPSGESTELADNLLISWNCDTDDDGSLSNNTPTSEFSMNQWLAGGNASLGTIAQGNAIFCRMIARVPSTATNDIAGDSVSFDVLYDATQSP